MRKKLGAFLAVAIVAAVFAAPALAGKGGVGGGERSGSTIIAMRA
jgi:hypothetical protein